MDAWVSQPSSGDKDPRYWIYALFIEGLLAVVLIVAMTWIVLSPVSDETSKAALVIVGSVVGFVFGRQTR